jgi:hypothetical protein
MTKEKKYKSYNYRVELNVAVSSPFKVSHGEMLVAKLLAETALEQKQFINTFEVDNHKVTSVARITKLEEVIE